jgi:glycosyltransferase involved in cell wall biosynthesis
MSVFNGGASLPATVESILSQEGCEFEFVVVNDGSTDQSGHWLDDRARQDRRLRVIHQRNTGLTRALIRGCAEARGEFIARQDCGDVSLPGRLQRQREILVSRPEVAMSGGAVRFVGPANESLFEVARPGESLHEGLAVLDLHRIEGPPHHGATMFRASAYRTVGGYRSDFVVAQDIDLWLRLCEIGLCIGDDAIVYQAKLEPGSISMRRRPEQFQLASLAIACAKLRRQGRNDAALLNGQSLPPSTARTATRAMDRARFYYFVASCLRKTDRNASRRYHWMAVREWPWFAKSWLRLVLG